MHDSKKMIPVVMVLLAATFGVFQISHANPVLTPGTWKEITPPTVPTGDAQPCLGSGITLDPKNPSTIFWCNAPYNNDTYGGIYKSTDAGSTWKRMGADSTDPNYWDNNTFMLDNPLRLRIDPANSLHMYACLGVRGGNLGFWMTTDGGVHWNKPDSYVTWASTIGSSDVYEVSVDPTDFNHLLLSFHSGWQNNVDAGIVESKDGGATWITHRIDGSGTAGKSIDFLYNPKLGIGNKDTWLMGTQGNGFWRTSDGGTTWIKVSDNCITHGGGNIYYTKAKKLYASGQTMCSTDNGISWTNIGSNYTWCIYGDGTNLYTGRAWGGALPLYTAKETNDAVWTDFNTQKFNNAPYDMILDTLNGIMYSSNWDAGVFAVKLTGTTNAPAINGQRALSAQTVSRNRLMVSNRNRSLIPGTDLYDIKGRLVNGPVAGLQAMIAKDRLAKD
jgi:hypothetical protein